MRMIISFWKPSTISNVFVCVLASLVMLPPSHVARAEPGANASEASEPFVFPTSENDAPFQFTSFPDLFNWNIRNPQPGWEEAVDWFLAGMKKEGPAFSLSPPPPV